MGLKYVKRPRMESLPTINEVTLASIGLQNYEFEKFDEQIIFDFINEQIDKVQDSMEKQMNLQDSDIGTEEDDD